MKNPTFDALGYPSSETLWHISNNSKGWREWLTFCARCWLKGYTVTISGDGNTFAFFTGGWSGNESVIEAMRQNAVGWSLTWQSSHRGGKHVFSVSDLEGGK